MGADELVCLALASGVSGYQCDALGNTALLLASTHNHKRSCELLMQATPKIEKVRNIGRQSAYDLAVSYGHPQIIRLFAKNPSDSDLGEAEIEAFRKQLDSWREGTLPGSLYHEGVPSAKVRGRRRAAEGQRVPTNPSTSPSERHSLMTAAR